MTTTVEPQLTIHPYQERVLEVPQDLDVAMATGRGGGKTRGLLYLAQRHCEEFGAAARPLYVRRSYPGLLDFEAQTREVFGLAYGRSATYNASAHVWRLPNGATFELGQLSDWSDYAKFQGRSFTLLLIDELGQWPDLALPMMLRANLRGPAGMPLRLCFAANPGGPSHGDIARRFVFGATPWEVSVDKSTDRQFVLCPSTVVDNPTLDSASYREQLAAACAQDPEILKAWLNGDWAISPGSYFGDVIDEQRNAVDPWPRPKPEDPNESEFWQFRRSNAALEWTFGLAMDWGSAAPCVTYLVAKSPGGEGPDGRHYSRDSIILIDECETSISIDKPDEGQGLTTVEVAEKVKLMARLWEVTPTGVADDATFGKFAYAASGSIGDELSNAGVRLRPAGKGDRLSGWQLMRKMLKGAGEPDVPGLYVSRSCGYWWRTVPSLVRDPRRPEDLQTYGQPAHAADACRYALLGNVGSSSAGFTQWP